jgi:hypothetical protein
MESMASNKTFDTVGSDSAIDIPSSMYRSEFGDWSLKIISTDKTFFNYEDFDITTAQNFKFDPRFQNPTA